MKPIFTEPDYNNIRQLIETDNTELAKQLLLGVQSSCRLPILELIKLIGCLPKREGYDTLWFYTPNGNWVLKVNLPQNIVELKLEKYNTGIHKGAIIFENMNEPNTIRGLFNRKRLIEIIM